MKKFTLAILIAVGVAAPAYAGHGPSPSARTVSNIAFSYPCNGGWSLERRNLREGVLGVAFPSQCRILVDSKVRPGSPQWDTIILHEVGHLAGRNHSSNRRSVMFPILYIDERVASHNAKVAYLRRNASRVRPERPPTGPTASENTSEGFYSDSDIPENSGLSHFDVAEGAK